MSFWCMDTYPSEQNKKSPAKNSKLDAIDNELVKTCKTDNPRLRVQRIVPCYPDVIVYSIHPERKKRVSMT